MVADSSRLRNHAVSCVCDSTISSVPFAVCFKEPPSSAQHRTATRMKQTSLLCLPHARNSMENVKILAGSIGRIQTMRHNTRGRFIPVGNTQTTSFLMIAIGLKGGWLSVAVDSPCLQAYLAPATLVNPLALLPSLSQASSVRQSLPLRFDYLATTNAVCLPYFVSSILTGP